jgi:hypothetical protein
MREEHSVDAEWTAECTLIVLGERASHMMSRFVDETRQPHASGKPIFRAS